MVKRYDLWFDAMVETADGDYVTYDDYAELQARADALEAALRFYAKNDDGGCIARITLVQYGKVK